MIIFETKDTDEGLYDMAEHMMDCINKADLPTDEYGFTKGTYHIKVTWSPDELGEE